MTREEKEIALYCLKASSDYHSEVCEECVKYPNCDHTIQDDVTETIIKALDQEPILDKIRSEIEQTSETIDGFLMHDGTKRTVLQIIDKYKAESEE